MNFTIGAQIKENLIFDIIFIDADKMINREDQNAMLFSIRK